jgi:hypothetical protein
MQVQEPESYARQHEQRRHADDDVGQPTRAQFEDDEIAPFISSAEAKPRSGATIAASRQSAAAKPASMKPIPLISIQ